MERTHIFCWKSSCMGTMHVITSLVGCPGMALMRCCLRRCMYAPHISQLCACTNTLDRPVWRCVSSYRHMCATADPMEREWKPTHAVPLLSVQGSDLACTVMEFDALVVGDLFVGSFDGELASATFVRPDDIDNPDYMHSVSRPHAGPVAALARSPYFPDILLSAGARAACAGGCCVFQWLGCSPVRESPRASG